MKRLFLLSFLFIAVALAAASNGKDPKPAGSQAPVEAIVVNGECGYLLQLSDGQLLKPQNLPAAYCKAGEKVAVILDVLKKADAMSCQAEKEVHIAAIHVYEKNAKARSKFGSSTEGRFPWQYSCLPAKR